MRTEGLVGPRILTDGQQDDLRLGKSGELIVTELHGTYYEQTYRGNVFCNALTTAGGLLNDGGSSPAPLGLYNPYGSGKNLVLIKTVLALAALPGTQVAGTIGYYWYTGTLTSTSLAPNPTVNCFIGGSGNQSVAIVYSGGITASALNPLLPIVSKTGATNPASSNTRIVDDVQGRIIIPPGSLIAIYETTADTTSNFTAVIGYMWEEVPI